MARKGSKSKSKSNGVPELLSHDSGSPRSEGELIDCLTEVISGRTAPATYGLTDIDHARDFLVPLDGGVQAMARADQEREDTEKKAREQQSEEKESEGGKLNLDEPLIGGTVVPGSESTDESSEEPEEEETETEEKPAAGKHPILIDPETGAPYKHQYQARQRLARKNLGPATVLATSLKIALGHVENFVKTAASWEVENDGHDVAKVLGFPGSSLGALGQDAIDMVKTFIRGVEAVAAIPDYKPAKKARGDSGPDSTSDTALVSGSTVWLRDKYKKAYGTDFNTDSELIVGKKVGTKYFVTVADPKEGEATVMLPRTELRTK